MSPREGGPARLREQLGLWYNEASRHRDARQTRAHSGHDATTGTISLSAVEKEAKAAAQSREVSVTSS